MGVSCCWSAVIAKAPSTAASEPARSSASASAERLRLATALVDLVHPDDLMLRQNLAGWEVGLRSAILDNPGLAKLASSYPGMVDAGIAAGRPIATRYVAAAIDKMKTSKARMTAEKLSEDELRTATAFFSSPAGKRLVKGFAANADVKGFAEDVLKRRDETGEFKITMADARKATAKAEKSTVGDASPEEVLALMKFEQTSAAKKLAEVGDMADRMMLEMANNPDPQWVAQQNDAVSGAMINFVERAQKPTP